MRNRQSETAVRAVLAKPIASRISGHLALDFCNTAGEHLADQPDEMLLNWESFLRWATQGGLIAPETYPELLRHPSPINKIVQLREAIYRVGLAIFRGDRIPQSDLLAIHAQAAKSKPTIVNARHGLR